MIIFVGAVKIIDCEDESWKTRIIHSKMFSLFFLLQICYTVVVVVAVLFYVHGKHLRSCWDGQLT